MPLEELRKLVEGLPAAALMAEGNERMFGIVRAILGSYLSPFSYLSPHITKDKAFSLTKWVQDEKNEGGWIYINYQDNQLATLKT
jgi:hypothetical protein